MEIAVEPMPLADLLWKSLVHWRSLRRWSEEFRYGTDAGIFTRVRWAENYARHQLTRYDTSLDEIAGKTGIDEAKQLIRDKVHAAIIAVWARVGDLRH